MKKIISILTAVSLTLSLSACSIHSDSASDESGGQIKLTDQANREVILEKPAETIVSAYYITTYTSVALGLTDKLIGIEKKAESRPIYSLAASELLDVTQVGSLKEFNIEAVAELHPELVLMPISLLEQANILEDLGLTVLVVNPETREGLSEMIVNIGKLTGSEERAQALIEAQDEIYATIETLVKDKEAPKVYMGSNSAHLETATSLMYQDFLITHAGGQNVFSHLEDNYWSAVSYEAILEQNPDYFIIPPAAGYTVQDVLNDTALSDLNAVKNQQVFKMPEGFEEIDSPVPSGVLGVYWLAVTLHGNKQDVMDYENTFSEFYKEFYGFDVA